MNYEPEMMSPFSHKGVDHNHCDNCKKVLESVSQFKKHPKFKCSNTVYKVRYRKIYMYVVDSLTYEEKIDVLMSLPERTCQLGQFPLFKKMLKDFIMKTIFKVQPMNKNSEHDYDYHYFFIRYRNSLPYYQHTNFNHLNLVSSEFLVPFKENKKASKSIKSSD